MIEAHTWRHGDGTPRPIDINPHRLVVINSPEHRDPSEPHDANNWPESPAWTIRAKVLADSRLSWTLYFKTQSAFDLFRRRCAELVRGHRG